MVRFAALIAALLVCGAAAARDVGQITSNSDPKTSAWFREAKSPGGTSSNGYHLSLLDPRDLTPTELVWDGPVVHNNPTAGAVVWLSWENGILLVRCFSPGPQS
jgi:hypothetical protein